MQFKNRLWQKRWEIFKTHKLGFWSLKILIGLFVVCCLGNVICNRRPIFLHCQDRFYFPFLKSYPETAFHGVFETEADYKDSYMEKFINQNCKALWPLIPYSPNEIDFALESALPAAPDSRHWLGTDDRGRDVLTRLMFGTRLSLLFGLALAFVGTLFGVLFGAIQGYFGGLVDLMGQRITEVWSSLPELFLLIILTSIFEPSITLMLFLMAAMGWMGLAAYVRAEYLRAREETYVQAAAAMGNSKLRTMFTHILPNALTPVIIFFPFRVSAGISGLASLDFLGLGVPSPTPSLGELLAQGKANLDSWWIIVSTFVMMVVLILCLNFIGEGVQKALDPKAMQ